MIKKHKKIIIKLLTSVLIGLTSMSNITVNAAPIEIAQAALGVDVSRYQGQIDWNKVKESGIQFAMIRIGYRLQSNGIMNEDPYAKYNLQEANRVGIKVGAYYFSTAVNAQEAVEEATWMCDILDSYSITFPVVYDCEGYTSKSSRQYKMNTATRTAIAAVFLDTVANRGYTPMFYASKNAMENNKYWDMTKLNKYKIWVASYPSVTFPNVLCNYSGIHSMWQYTEKAAIAGIDGEVDLNVSYFDYSEIAQPKVKENAALSTIKVSTNIQYTSVLEVVSTNTVVNLRTEPSTNNPNTVVGKLKSGDMVWRVGIGNDGWSQIKLPNIDQIYYAYSSYLTKIQ